MPVAFDAVSSVSSASDFDEDLSWTHTPVGTPTGVILFVAAGPTDEFFIVDAANYGGMNFTVVDIVSHPTDGIMGVLKLDDPPPGPQTIEVSGTVGPSCFAAVAVTITGSHADVVSNNAQAQGTDDSPTVDVTSVANELVISAVLHMAASNEELATGAGQTARASVSDVNGTDGADMRLQVSTKPGVDGTVTMEYSASGSLTWQMLSVSVKEGALVTPTVGFRSLMSMWLGGASVGEFVPPPDDQNLDGWRPRVRRRRIEERELAHQLIVDMIKQYGPQIAEEEEEVL